MTAETVSKTTRITITVGTIVATAVVVFTAGAWASTIANGLTSIKGSVGEIKQDIRQIKDATGRDNQALRDRVMRLETQLDNLVNGAEK